MLKGSFLCSCGKLVEIPSHMPRVRDAAVIHCSACGAAKSAGNVECRSCLAQFKAFEVDRSTMCPKCFARISDKSHFCHSCGGGIDPKAFFDSQKSHLDCPGCNAQASLLMKALGKEAQVLECDQCSGLFLHQDELERIVSKVNELSLGDLRSHNVSTVKSETAIHVGPFYRSCPYCKTLMNRKNFGNRSGVIIDVCGKHGIWFDSGELERIVIWVKNGGLQHARKLDQEIADETRKTAGKDRVFSEPVLQKALRDDSFDQVEGGFLIADLLADLFAFLTKK